MKEYTYKTHDMMRFHVPEGMYSIAEMEKMLADMKEFKRQQDEHLKAAMESIEERMTYKHVEITVTLIGEDYKQNLECYTQRINYEHFQQAKPNMVAEIIAVVNDLRVPQYQAPMSPDEINLVFDKEYSLHKDRMDNKET